MIESIIAGVALASIFVDAILIKAIIKMWRG
jgi:hypothetical protein